jgi:hypothetical protein
VLVKVVLITLEELVMKNQIALFVVVALASALLLSACSSTNPQTQQMVQTMVTNGQKCRQMGKA